MNVTPVVRYMILCNDWRLDPTNQNRVNIYGLLSSIDPVNVSPYPFIHSQLCVLLVLTENRGTGKTRIRCVFEESGELIFETAEHEINGTADPLELIAVPFRIFECEFPRPGMYSVQFWYNETMVHECPLHLRGPS